MRRHSGSTVLSRGLPLALAVAGFALGAAGGAALSAEQAAPPAAPSLNADPVKPGKPETKPYLTEANAPDPLRILSPPPAHHSPLDNADHAAFNATRSLKGSARWNLAANDVSEGSIAVLENFACVLGSRLDQARVPATLNLLDRARLDLARATRIPKVHYRRLRPFVGNEAPICVQRTQTLTDSFSYPSGHATQGWAYALIMAALVPDKATDILARGRSYGESRIVCGVHYPSDVMAGRTNGASVFAALIGDATFRSDLDKARNELRAALTAGGAAPDKALCTREAEALKEPPIEF